MKEIRIFIASSKELLPERNYLSYLTLALEDEFGKRGLRVRLSKWEYVDPRMTEERTEDRYLDEMYACDAALVLFRNFAGKYTREELDKAIAAERAGTTRLKAHEILFAADCAQDSEAARLRSSLSEDACGGWSNQNELRDHFLALINRVEQCGNLVEAPSEKNVRKITAFLAADVELSAERDAFADTVLNVNDLLELAHRNLRVAIRFYDPGHEEEILNACEMGLVIYGTNCHVFGKNEIQHTYERVKNGSQNPKRFYVFFRDLDENTEKTLDDAFRTFRDDFVTKLGHFTCQFGDANALRLSFLLSLERYAGEMVREYYSTVDAPSSVFVGRDEEIKRLLAFLEQGFEKYSCGRIPVVTGAGGTGKSELVRQYAFQRKVGFPGGVFQVDMERMSSVDEAFLGLLDRTSNNGIKVADWLGLGQDGESESGQENGGTSRKISGADVRDAILRRARTSGPILLFLDNVEDCGIFEKGAAQFFPAGFSERVRVNVIATARVFNADSEDGSVVEFQLGDLASDAALELLLAKHPAKTGEEKQAAAHVAQLLGYRALFLRRVPAIIGTKNFKKTKMVCRSYASLAKKLEADTLTTISSTGKIDEEHLPGKLWDLTRESLSECLLGDAAIRLIRLAAHFPADGFPKSVLRRLWDTEVFPNCGEEETSADEAFDFVLDMGRSYNIFQSTDPVRIHRLDREAILHELGGEKCELENAIGRTLASCPYATPGLWRSLAEFSGIMREVPSSIGNGMFYAQVLSANPELEALALWDKFGGSGWSLLLCRRPQFADKCQWEKLDGSDWARLLCEQPLFADKYKCPWEKLDGPDWANLLGLQPLFADKCQRDRLNGWDWARLLGKQPQFEDRCLWDKLKGGDWAWLLGQQPQFEDRCPWDSLNGSDWAGLLREQPQFMDRCPWDRLTGSDWANLLGKQPQFMDRCPWDRLTGSDWARLLGELPQFADKCHWEKLDGGSWADLLRQQPQFADKCPWEKLDGSAWADLLRQQPQFADKCPWEKLDGRDWARLLGKFPQFEGKCPWEKLDGRDWARLLGELPQFADKCPWEKLDGSAWARLLRKFPQFADKCPWEKLDGSAWARLLFNQPQFADKCPWEKLDGSAWARLLFNQPQFADKCPWEKLDGSAWADLLRQQPQFADKCPWEKLDGSAWAWLLGKFPQFEGKCPWEKLDGRDWANLLQEQPQFADKCPWEKLDGSAWARLLGKFPQFEGKCPWEKLDGRDWADLLRQQPQFADKCPWEKLDGSAWARLLFNQPQFEGKCPWEKLDGGDWARLLEQQPQFADKCPWEKLDGSAWAWLLGKFPQFEGKCPWEKLDGGDWARLLGQQPQFADKCPWEKLDGSAWAWLLREQPQFADKCPWEKLDGSAWARLLGKFPQFADKCPWEKLDGSNWVRLLREQPQFAEKCSWEQTGRQGLGMATRWNYGA